MELWAQRPHVLIPKYKFRSFCYVWYYAAAFAEITNILWNKDGPKVGRNEIYIYIYILVIYIDVSS